MSIGRKVERSVFHRSSTAKLIEVFNCRSFVMSNPEDAPLCGETERPNRRTALMLGAFAAMAISTPAIAGSIGASEELIAWRAARATYFKAADAHAEFLMVSQGQHGLLDSPEFISLDDAMGAAEAPYNVAVERMLARPVHSFGDLVELAEVVRGEERWNPSEYDEGSDDAPSREVIALFDAIEALAKTRVDVRA